MTLQNANNVKQNGGFDPQKGPNLPIPSKQNFTNPLTQVTETPFDKWDIRKYWEREELNTQISGIKNQFNRVLITFLWRSCLRITEAVSLRKMDINFKHYVMKVRWLKSRKYKERMVPMHPGLVDMMQLYVAPYKAEERIFPITRQRGWQIVKKELGGHPHMLRHSFAINWLRCGGDIVILHRIMGHSRIQTTMEYLKIVPIDQGKELLKIQF